jgi:hypothetical protein
MSKLKDVLSKKALELDINIGDILLGGRFKNKREVVEEISEDNLGQPTINGKKLLSFRIEKKLPKNKQSRQTREKAAADTLQSLVAQGWTRPEAQELLDMESGKIKRSESQLIQTDGIPRSTPYIKGDKSKMTPKQRQNHGAIYHQGVLKMKEMRKKQPPAKPLVAKLSQGVK